eukprot:31093_1
MVEGITKAMVKHNNKIVLELIKEQRWNDVRFKTSCGCTEVSCGSCADNHTLLHYVCQFRPPLHIVESLVRDFPEAVNQADCANQYPLHVAVHSGSSSHVIAFLLQANPSIASLQDEHGMTPLHLAFCNYRGMTHNGFESAEDVEKSIPKVAKLLCMAAPLSVIVEDKEGLNVLEHAIEKEVDLKLLRNLQRVAQNVKKGKIQATYKSSFDNDLRKGNCANEAGKKNNTNKFMLSDMIDFLKLIP